MMMDMESKFGIILVCKNETSEHIQLILVLTDHYLDVLVFELYNIFKKLSS